MTHLNRNPRDSTRPMWGSGGVSAPAVANVRIRVQINVMSSDCAADLGSLVMIRSLRDTGTATVP
eukprot:4019648-Lingulodinium_polyedra.AAC.1